MAQALMAAGFTGDALVKMTAYGISESEGNSTVINNTPATGDYSVGWFQINYFGPLRASRTARYGPPEQLAQDRHAQAAAAWDLSNHGTNFGPWVGDVINGKLRKNTPLAQQIVSEAMTQPQQATLISTNPVPIIAGAVGGPIVGAIAGSGNPISSAAGALGTIGHLASVLANPHFWLRVGEFVAGLALIFMGALWLISESKSVGGVVKTGVKAGTKVAEVAAA